MQVQDPCSLSVQPNAVIPGGQFKEGLVGQLVADEGGDLCRMRFTEQVSLEAGEVVERVEFEQGGASSLCARGVAPQPLATGA